ncbi:MAG: 23S rRNA (uracil(1939)-C(5))-methyltransferase RlmD, partial [Bacilli bacterium]|nr:23S rRNA (uracil(1939)-C(5))-methyltransferase RlmD [Bacilli bacterium]
MDPPRSGSTKEFLSAVLKLAPKRIVYVSCNPYTQVEDLKTLLNDYMIMTIQPVDMFPQTSHVETVVLLTLKNQK